MAVPGVLVDEPAAGVRRIRLNDPERRNALSSSLVEALHEAFLEAPQGVTILGSTDPRAFCAGADLGLGDGERAALSDRLYRLYESMVTLPGPIVAVVEGAAVGGGAQLAVAADLRVGGPGARFRFPGAGHGLAVGVWALPGLVGRGRAMEVCLSERWVGADEALAIGLLDRLVERPVEDAVELAVAIARRDPDAVARIKRIANDATLRERLRQEREQNATWGGSVAGLAGGRERHGGG